MSVYTFVLTETRPGSGDHATRMPRRAMGLWRAANCLTPVTPVSNNDGYGDVQENHVRGVWSYTWRMRDPSDYWIYVLAWISTERN
jgi:hypothetical protein